MYDLIPYQWIILTGCMILMIVSLVLIFLSGCDRGYSTLKMPKGNKIIREELNPNSGYGSCYVGCRG